MLFTLNPNAGKGAKNNEMFNAIDSFIKSGYDVETYITQSAGDLTNVLKAKADKYDTIVVWGGDGTLNEGVNGLMLAPKSVVSLGYIPRGTVNDFASSLCISKKSELACENICKGTPKFVDLGKFGERYFTYVAAFGAFTRVSYATSQRKKKLLARLAYLIEGVKSVPTIKPTHAKVTVGGEVFENDYVYGMISNSKSVGGFKIPDMVVDMNDGEFEVLLVTMPKNLGQWFELITTLLSKKMSSPLIKIIKTNEAKFEFSKETPWTVDGEFGGNTLEITVSAVKSAIKIICPGNNN